MSSVPAFERPQDYVAQQLRQAILDGTYAAGDRLPIERDLSERFGVSRSAIRQSLLILTQQGLVKVRSGAGGGPFVTRGSLGGAITAIENVLASNPVAVEEFVQAKLILEPEISRYAAVTISAEYMDLLRQNIAESRAALRRKEDTNELAVEFHSILIRSCENRYLALILELFAQALQRLPDPPGNRPVDQRRVVREHEELVRALEERDAETVRRLTTEHLEKLWHGHASPSSGMPDTGKKDTGSALAL